MRHAPCLLDSLVRRRLGFLHAARIYLSAINTRELLVERSLLERADDMDALTSTSWAATAAAGGHAVRPAAAGRGEDLPTST